MIILYLQNIRTTWAPKKLKIAFMVAESPGNCFFPRDNYVHSTYMARRGKVQTGVAARAKEAKALLCQIHLFQLQLKLFRNDETMEGGVWGSWLGGGGKIQIQVEKFSSLDA